MLVKHKSFNHILTLLVLVLVAATFVFPAFAANDGMIFAVSPRLPENQTDSGLGYFDLLVSPGDSQTIKLQVSNSSDKPITIEVEAVNASTSNYGSRDFISGVTPDETLIHPFESIATPTEKRLVIQGKSEATIALALKIPSQEFDGLVVGGITVTDITERLKREEATETDEDPGIQIFNEYQFLTGVVLRENDTVVEPDFQLVSVEVGLDNYEPSIITTIRNPQPLIIKEATYSGSIYVKGDNEPIFSINDAKVEFSPNSVMNYNFVDKAGYGIKAGDYTFKGKIVYQGTTWPFEEDFRFEKEEIEEVNSGAMVEQIQRGPDSSILIIIIGVILLLILIILIILLIRMKKRHD